jgi:ubiquinone/menaquinone biosynthesis C-methylase UbiE
MTLDHWESYYRGGALVSCPTGPEPNYSKEVREVWSGFFAALPNDARILDIGCGNGPVALIAAETAAELSRNFHIDAVDRAMIDPPANVPDGEVLFADVRFHSGVSSEDLPFESVTFDATCGQYIIEYTDIRQTFAEVFRVLRPHGKSQFILHHTDSVVVANARASLRQADLVIKDARFIRLFRNYWDKVSVSAQKVGNTRQALFNAGSLLEQEASRSENPLFLRYVLDSVSTLLQKQRQMSKGQMLQAADRLERELKNWIRRLSDLVSGARSEADMIGIVSIAEALGFEDVGMSLQMQDHDNLVGWRLNMQKASSE